MRQGLGSFRDTSSRLRPPHPNIRFSPRSRATRTRSRILCPSQPSIPSCRQITSSQRAKPYTRRDCSREIGTPRGPQRLPEHPAPSPPAPSPSSADKSSTMVVKTDLCAFSEFKIYPGNGKTFVRRDGQCLRFISRKVRAPSPASGAGLPPPELARASSRPRSPAPCTTRGRSLPSSRGRRPGGGSTRRVSASATPARLTRRRAEGRVLQNAQAQGAQGQPVSAASCARPLV